MASELQAQSLDEVKEGIRNKPADPSRPAWSELVASFAETGERIGVLSSEFFADAGDEAAARVVADLGGARTQVLVTLRPLAKIMPSQWQQNVQSGMATPYEEWLTELLDKPDEPTAARFWHRHRHDLFVKRWAAAADPERVTVLVVDDSQPDRLLRDFEALLGLPEETLRKEKNTTNRSLTAGETEAVRATAAAFERNGWSKALFRQYVRYGVVPRIKTARRPGPAESKIATPGWALERAAGIGGSMADVIAASGVRVIGDLGLLRGEDVRAAEPGELLVDPDVTVQAILGCMNAVMKHRDDQSAAPERNGSLLRVVGQRTKKRLFGSRDRA
ncbi:hypothetical protein GCM10029992_29590 [Glycomyces albus]